MLYPGYVLGQPLTVPEGEVKYITVYNGAQVGVLTFKSIFSGAVANTLMTVSAIAALAMSNMF